MGKYFRMERILKTIILFVILIWVSGCSNSKQPILTFSFQLNNKEGFIPSNQIAIWLQNYKGEYIETLFVCDYLSYGGYTVAGICPSWVSKSKWESKPKEVVDAVSQATPDVGDVTLNFNFPVKKVDPGKYQYCIEVHIAENFNELYVGEIEIRSNSFPLIGKANVAYLPAKYSKGSDLLSNVNVTYQN